MSKAKGGTELTRLTVMQEFSHIELTEKEKALGLLHAYNLATKRLEEEEKKRRRELMITEAKRMWTYEECKAIILERAKVISEHENFEFIIDEHNEYVFHLLCLYFTNDPAFEDEDFEGVPYSLKKGIWIQSPGRGTGKSLFLRLFENNKRCCFWYQHVEQLRVMFMKAGINEIERRTQLVEASPGPGNFFQTEKGFMYDELFGEEKVNYMGSPVNMSSLIISSLYDFKKGQDWFWKFHVTSNYSGQEIEEKCGKTVRSRMVEMFNLIKLEGPDRRIKRKK